jgi:hypothetical protein
MSSSSLVSAAFGNKSAAKSQCGRAWRNGLRRATKRAESANVGHYVVAVLASASSAAATARTGASAS